MNKKNCESPCLCDTCLKARDKEIARSLKGIKKKCIYNERGQCNTELGHRLSGKDCAFV